MTFLGGVVVHWNFCAGKRGDDGIKIPNERISFLVGRSHRCVITRGLFLSWLM
jgi:hypothetical protein